MDEREFEQLLKQLMKQDLSAETAKFRDSLLEQCLAILDASDEGVPLDDSVLDLLAAAGDPYSYDPENLTGSKPPV